LSLFEDEAKRDKRIRLEYATDFIGDVVPYAFWWENGILYEIDDVMGWERAASVRAGIIGMRYFIRVRDREIYLYSNVEFQEINNHKTL